MIDPKISLVFNEPVQYSEKVNINVPTIYEAVLNPNYGIYVRLFTISTRLMFGQLRNVDQLEAQFPTVWDMMYDDEADILLGKILGVDYAGSQLFIESLEFWTGLKNDGEDGFVKLSNKKMIHAELDWVIDKAEFVKISKMIQMISCYNPESEAQFIPPRNMSDAKFDTWTALYKGRSRNANRNSSSIADKIGLLAISTDCAILPEQMKTMSVFLFNKLYDGLQSKEAYEKYWQIQISPKFEGDKHPQKHWRETFKI